MDHVDKLYLTVGGTAIWFTLLLVAIFRETQTANQIAMIVTIFYCVGMVMMWFVDD